MDDATWKHARKAVEWLDKANGLGEAETARRVVKLSEEVGEVAQAYIGSVGQNPRKGKTHMPEDVATELCDVVITAMVAMHEFVTDPEEFFNQVVAGRSKRLSELTGEDQED